MPFSVAELVRHLRLEDCVYEALAVVDAELDCAVDHLQDDHVNLSADGQEEAGRVSRLNPHVNVKVDADTEPTEGHDPAALRPEEVARLHFLGAGDDVVVLLPFAERSHPALATAHHLEPDLSQAANKAGHDREGATEAELALNVRVTFHRVVEAAEEEAGGHL